MKNGTSINELRSWTYDDVERANAMIDMEESGCLALDGYRIFETKRK